MSVEHKFAKNIVAFPSADNSITFAVTVSSLITPTDEASIAVYYNGQLIKQYTTGDTTVFAKYYYMLTNNNSAYIASPTTVGIESSCSVTFNLYANQNFVAPGYTTGSQDAVFDSADVIYVSYDYTIVGAN